MSKARGTGIDEQASQQEAERDPHDELAMHVWVDDGGAHVEQDEAAPVMES